MCYNAQITSNTVRRKKLTHRLSGLVVLRKYLNIRGDITAVEPRGVFPWVAQFVSLTSDHVVDHRNHQRGILREPWEPLFLHPPKFVVDPIHLGFHREAPPQSEETSPFPRVGQCRLQGFAQQIEHSFSADAEHDGGCDEVSTDERFEALVKIRHHCSVRHT